MVITAARKRHSRFIVGSSLDCFVFPVIPVSWIGFKPASVARAVGSGGQRQKRLRELVDQPTSKLAEYDIQTRTARQNHLATREPA